MAFLSTCMGTYMTGAAQPCFCTGAACRQALGRALVNLCVAPLCLPAWNAQEQLHANHIQEHGLMAAAPPKLMAAFGNTASGSGHGNALAVRAPTLNLERRN